METTKQASQRIGIPLHTLYRRLQRLCENGKLVLTPDDYVSRCLYLSAAKWDEICSLTPSPGRPRTGLAVPPAPTKDSR
jgi:transposase